MKLKKTQHIAFITREAMWWKEFENATPFLKTFARIPRGVGCSRFTVQWITEDVCAIRFSTWKRRRRRRP